MPLNVKQNARANTKAIKARFQKLYGRFGQKWAALAADLGRSESTVSAWKSGEMAIARGDAIELALRDQDHSANELEHVKYWLQITGHKDELADKKIVEEIKRRTSLAGGVEEALRDLVKWAKRKQIDRSDFLLALSCFLGQKRLSDDIEQWKLGTQGVGTAAYFWRWHDGICRRFEKEAVREFVRDIIEPKDTIIRDRWSPPGTQSKLKVIIFLQMSLAKSEFAEAKRILHQATDKFVDELALPGTTKRERFQILIAKEPNPHAADCCVFVSANRTFGVLISESGELINKMEESTDPEIAANPYLWCGQIIHLTEKKFLKEDYLQRCHVELRENDLVPDGTWEPFFPKAK
jgi:hypothetical protein